MRWQIISAADCDAESAWSLRYTLQDVHRRDVKRGLRLLSNGLRWSFWVKGMVWNCLDADRLAVHLTQALFSHMLTIDIVLSIAWHVS